MKHTNFYEAFLIKARGRKIAKRIIAVMSVFVLLVTIDQLKFVAVTLESASTCGYEAHVHDAACYDDIGQLICGKEEHVHGIDCAMEAADEVVAETLDVSTEPEEIVAENVEPEGEELPEYQMGDVVYAPEDEVIAKDAPEETEDAPEGYVVSDQYPFYLSDVIARQGLDIAMDDVEKVGQVYEDEDELVLSCEAVEGDFACFVLSDFVRIELGITLRDGEVVPVELLYGIAPMGGTDDEADAEPVIEPAEEQTAEPVVEPIGEQSVKTVDEPAEEQGTETVDEPTEEQSAETVDEPVEEQTVETVDEPAEEQSAETVDEPTEEETDETTVELTEEPVEETGEEPAEEEAVGSAQEEVDEIAEELADETVEEPSDEPVMEAATEPTGEETDEPAEEKVDEPAEEPAAEPVKEELPDESGIEASDEGSADEPVKEQADESMEETSDEPAGESTEKADEEAADEPAEEPSDEMIEDPVVEPDGESADEPSEEAAEEPAAEPVIEENIVGRLTIDFAGFDVKAIGEAGFMTVDGEDGSVSAPLDALVERGVECGLAVTGAELLDAEMTYGDSADADAPVSYVDGTLIIRGDGELTLTGENGALAISVAGFAMPTASAEGEGVTVEAVNDNLLPGGASAHMAGRISSGEGDALIDGLKAYLSAGSIAEGRPRKAAKAARAKVATAAESQTCYAVFDVSVLDAEENPITETGAVEVTLRPGISLYEALPENIRDVRVSETALYHYHDGEYEDAALLGFDYDEESGVIRELRFETHSFSEWVLRYTVEYTTVENQVDVSIDFTDIVNNGVDFDESALLSAFDAGVAIDLAELERGYAEAGDGMAEGALSVTYESVDAGEGLTGWAAMEAVSADAGLEVENGQLRVTADGEVALSDGETTVIIAISGYSDVVARIKSGFATIEDAEGGHLPINASASAAVVEGLDAIDLVKQTYGEQAHEAYTVFAIDTDAKSENGFRVTLDLEQYDIAGRDFQLYHVHDGAVEPLDVTVRAVTDENGLEQVSAIAFETPDFSDFVLGYTVEFYNGDEMVRIVGGSQVLLSALLRDLEITHPATGEIVDVDAVAAVEFDAPELFNVREVIESPVEVNGEDVELTSGHDFLITSLEPFDETAMRLTLYDGPEIVVRVTDQVQDSLTTTIRFFAMDAKICKQGEDSEHRDWDTHIVGLEEAPTLTKQYYVRAILKDSAGKELGWAVKKMDLNAQASSFSTYFNEFHPFEAQEEGESDEDYNARRGQDLNSDTLAYKANENTVETRLFRVDNSLAEPLTYHALVAEPTAVDSPEEGYEFGGNFYYPDKQNEIHIKKANNKRLKVRVTLDADATQEIAAGDNYYVYAEIRHASNETSYQYAPLVITAADIARGYVEYDFSEFMDQNGNLKNAKQGNSAYTGNEVDVSVTLLKFQNFKPNNKGNAAIVTDGSAIKTYKVTYGEKQTVQSTETVDGAVKTYEDSVYTVALSSIDAEGQYNYASVLGPNLNYGIVADHLYHYIHLQTNFAVNHYTGNGADARPDLSGKTSGGSVVIGQYNTMASDYANGSVTNNVVGDVVNTAVSAGQFNVGSPLNGNLVIYVDKDSGSPDAISSNGDSGKVRGNYNQTTVIQAEGQKLSDEIVEPALRYGVDMSEELAAHAVTFDPPIPGSGKLELDTTAFPNDATIFINGSRILAFIQEAGQLEIHKRDDQMIVFNFPDEVPVGQEIALKQFKVYQDSIPDGYTTQTPESTNQTANDYMDKIARHIVWNLSNVKGTTKIAISCGIFLQPNENSKIDVVGTTAGWIVSEGLVVNSAGEWHNVYSEMPETSSVKLHAFKRVDGKAPRASQKFEFFLDEYDKESNNWIRRDEVTNKNGSVEFKELKSLTTGWHVYRIMENPEKPSDTHGFYSMDQHAYYALVRVQTIGEKTVVDPPKYYSAFDPAAFRSDSGDVPTGVDPADKVNSVTFRNTEAVEGLSIIKKVDGTTDTDTEFTFEIELWRQYDHDTQKETAFLQNTTYNVVTSAGTEQLTLTNDEAAKLSRGTIKLKAGQIKSIQGLPSGTFFRITETLVNGKPISTTEYVDGYKAMTAPQTGSMETEHAAVAVTFNNVYYATAKAQIEATKVMQGRGLNAGDFTFQLHKDSADGVVIDTKTNAADGKVTFDEISYTTANLADTGVVDGRRTKEFTYYICEVVPEPADSGIAYAEPVQVTVTVVDDGKGNMTATVNTPDAAGIQIVNTLKTQQTLQGTKTLVGRDMEAGEEFRFIVKEGEKEVATGTVTGGLNGEAKGIDFTPIVYTYDPTTTTYPVVHEYTIVEDTTALPANVTHDPAQTFTATVTVSYDAENHRLVAGVPVYSPDPVAFTNTYDNPDKTSVKVRKEWVDGTGDKATLYLMRYTKDEETASDDLTPGDETVVESGSMNVTVNLVIDKDSKSQGFNMILDEVLARCNYDFYPYYAVYSSSFEKDGNKWESKGAEIVGVDKASIKYQLNGYYYGLDSNDRLIVTCTAKDFTGKTFDVANDNFNNSLYLNAQAGDVTITFTVAPKETVQGNSLASPFQLAFNPFAAQAEDGSLEVDVRGLEHTTFDGYTRDESFVKVITLSNGNWEKTIGNLDATDGQGHKYYYAIAEGMMDGYTVTYDHDAPVVAGGLVTLTATNTATTPQTTALRFSKKWLRDGAEVDWPSGAHITVQLYGQKGAGEFLTSSSNISANTVEVWPEMDETSLALTNKPDGTAFATAKVAYDGTNKQFVISGLPTGWTYHVKEEQVSGWLPPEYSSADGAYDEGTITNRAVNVTLPATGGPGTTRYTAAGLALVMLAAALLLRKRRD